MENLNRKLIPKIGAWLTLIGTILMLIGAILFGVSGADLDKALDMNDLAGYLSTANQNSAILIANLTIWIIGVFLLGIAGTMMAKLCVKNQITAKIALYNYWVAVPLVVAAYVAWLAIVVRLAPLDSELASTIAEVVGWFASRADWIATILILSIGPLLISIAGCKDWVPGWLYRWSIVALLAGLLNAIAMFAGGLTTYGFLIIPVGMGWMIATSIVLFKIIPQNE